MHADIKGALEQINRSYRAFEHRGVKMTKQEVRKVLEYGIKKGYQTTDQFSDEEVDIIIKNKTFVCEKCQKNTDEVFMCERCEVMICDGCQATYNLFSQIDFNCCKNCAEQDPD